MGWLPKFYYTMNIFVIVKKILRKDSIECILPTSPFFCCSQKRQNQGEEWMILSFNKKGVLKHSQSQSILWTNLQYYIHTQDTCVSWKISTGKLLFTSIPISSTKKRQKICSINWLEVRISKVSVIFMCGRSCICYWIHTHILNKTTLFFFCRLS